MQEEKETLRKSRSNRYYPVDDEACKILKEKNIVDLLRWLNMLVCEEDRDIICHFISRYISDTKKLKTLGA